MSHGQFAKAQKAGQAAMQPPTLIYVPDAERLESLHCPYCKNNIFDKADRLWVIPALMSQSGLEEIGEQLVRVCRGCGLAWDQTTLKRFTPAERKELQKEMQEKMAQMQAAAAAKRGQGSDGTKQVCRVCGCTEEHACEGGCSWVEPDLCSACAEGDKKV
jgi:hypothetical protein